jgi:hypothetical protein
MEDFNNIPLNMNVEFKSHKLQYNRQSMNIRMISTARVSFT